MGPPQKARYSGRRTSKGWPNSYTHANRGEVLYARGVAGVVDQEDHFEEEVHGQPATAARARCGKKLSSVSLAAPALAILQAHGPHSWNSHAEKNSTTFRKENTIQYVSLQTGFGRGRARNRRPPPC